MKYYSFAVDSTLLSYVARLTQAQELGMAQMPAWRPFIEGRSQVIIGFTQRTWFGKMIR
jgi:hypothetical protein